MRLSEFTKPSTKKNAEAILLNAGYKRLGSGCFADVYHKEGASYVLKLFVPADKAYLDYIKLVQANPNEHFPKFVGKLIRVTPDYYAIRTELLEPFIYDKETEKKIDMIGGYLYFSKIPPTRPEKIETFKIIQKWMNKNSSLKDACDLIAKRLLKKYHEDVSANNIMLRGNTIVLTDPVC
jgi:hypothetical protein